MRCDSAIASIYDEVGLEIENVEILFTHEGMKKYKIVSFFEMIYTFLSYMNRSLHV